jgi:beta-glucosidase
MNKRIILMIWAVGACLLTWAQTYLDAGAPIEERVQDALSRMTLHEKVAIIHAQSKFTSAGVPRLGIRQLNMDDGPHGCREEIEWNSWSPAHWTNDSCVAFPSLTCLAATWNRALSSVYGNAISEEFAYRGKDVILGPGLNIARMPLNGRSFEYMGEDPYLTGEMAVPYIQAAQKNGVGCCIKHFFMNNQEMDRFRVNVNVSERAVEEIYLPAFEKAVTIGKAWCVMGSYNKWLGEWCSQNDSLLNGILKRRWGFDGAVMSDWNATHSTESAAYGGLDLEMGTDNKRTHMEAQGYGGYYLADDFERLVAEGKIPIRVVNEKAARVLRTIFRTAMNRDKVIGNQCSEAHYNTCLEIGEEGIVLLKNDANILPLNMEKYRKVLVVGDNATRSMSYGGGSSELKTKFDIAPLDALRELYGDKIVYAQGYTAGKAIYNKVDPIDASLQDSLKQAALAAARNADLVIFVGGMNKNHRQDCEDGDRENYDLSYGQNELIAALAKIQHNTVVVTFGGNPFATPWLQNVKAMVHCWYLGSMSGKTLTNVLSGAVNPSGKLPVTFAKQQSDYPCFQYGKEGYPGVDKQVYYKEGIYVGYRYFDTKRVKPVFPFGFGLSYTTFQYGKPTISSTTLSQDGSAKVRIPITNMGKRKGKEVVQLYISQPSCSVDRPAKELKGFEKVELNPGETKTVEFTITPRDLAYYSEDLHAWKTEPGTFKILIGASETDIRGNLNLQYK